MIGLGISLMPAITASGPGFSSACFAQTAAGTGPGNAIVKGAEITSHQRKLIWSDEFSRNGAPDSSKWGYDLGASGWGNEELEYYTSRPQNAVVKNGVLRITALREDYQGSAYTSARLLSKMKFSFRYGRVEARAKLPAGIGTWPAIWMLGNDIDKVGWPDCGEVDIMEHRGKEPGKIFGTLHYPGHSGGSGNGNTRMITAPYSKFHVFALEWSPAEIKIYVDGQLYHTVVNTPDIPFHQDFFLIMNLAMGGGFAGPVDPSFKRAAMEVDYIRVYQ